MCFLTAVVFSMLLLLGVIMGPVLGQDELVSKITRGFAATYDVPTHFTYAHTTSTSSILQLQPTNINNLNPNTGPPHIGHESNSSTTGKLIGLLFAGGAILLVFTFILLAFCVKRHKKNQQKRIQDWVEFSALHDRYSVLGNCGTPATEMAAWRDGKIEEGKVEEVEMQVPEQVVVRNAKLGGLWGIAE